MSRCFIKERKGNALFNDTLNTFYLRLYGVGHMVKDHSDSERGNPLPPHGLLFPIQFFYMHHPTDRIAHTTAFVTPIVEHWLEREIAQWVHPMKDRSDDPSHHERTLLSRSLFDQVKSHPTFKVLPSVSDTAILSHPFCPSCLTHSVPPVFHILSLVSNPFCPSCLAYCVPSVSPILSLLSCLLCPFCLTHYIPPGSQSWVSLYTKLANK